MSNFKFGFLAYLAIFLLFLPMPFGLAWGYKAIPIAVVCFALACFIAKKLFKDSEK